MATSAHANLMLVGAVLLVPWITAKLMPIDVLPVLAAPREWAFFGEYTYVAIEASVLQLHCAAVVPGMYCLLFVLP